MLTILKRGFPLVLFSVLITISITCSKKGFEQSNTPRVTDSLLFISNIKQIELNEFLVEYHFDNTQHIEVEDFGIDIHLSNHSEHNKTISLRKRPSSLITGSFLLKELKGDSIYTIRLYTISVSEKDTFYSASKTVKSLNLHFITRDEEIKFPRPFNNIALKTNLPDSNKGLHSRMWIGDTECTVEGENGPFIIFSIPENIPYGYHSVKLQRKQLEARIDSVYIYFGKSKNLDIYPETSSPGNPDLRVMYNVFQLGNKGYLFGGERIKGGDITPDGGVLTVPKYFFEYDGSSNSWLKVPYSIPVNFKFPIVETANNEAYVVGGYLDTTFSNGSFLSLENVYRFDLPNKTWIKKAPIPWWPLYRARTISFSIGGRIYIGLGEGGNFDVGSVEFRDIWEYDPSGDKWTKKSDFPGAPRSYASAFVINDKAYVFGGTILHDGHIVGDVTNELWEYTPANDSWKQINYQNGPEPMFSANGFSYAGKGYIVGGFKTLWSPGGKVNVPSTNWQFDPQSETFLEINSYFGGKPIYQNGNAFVLVFSGLEGDPSVNGQAVYEFKAE